MKLTDAQRFELYKAALQGVAAKPTWPDTSPPAKDGSTKKCAKAWAIATWATRIARAAADAIEKDSQHAEAPASSTAASGGEFSS